MTKRLISTALTIAFTAQTLAFADESQFPSETELEQNHLPVAMMGTLFTVNSAMTTEQALHALLPAEDFANVIRYFEKEKIDITQQRMFDALVYDGKIHYGGKTATIEADFSVKVDGFYLKYNKGETPAQNYLRFLKQFLGKTPGKESFAALLEPSANAQEKAVAPVVAPAVAATVDASAAAPAAAPVVENAVAGAATAAEARAAFFRSLGSNMSGAIKQTYAGLRSANSLLGQAGDRALAAGVAGARGAAAGTARVAGQAVAGASRVAAGTIEAVTGSVAGTAGAVRAAAVAGATLASPYVAAAAVALGVTAVAAASVYGVSLGINYAYHYFGNGRFTCGPKDTDGKSSYIFNYTSDNTDYLFEHFDQRVFTSVDMASLFLHTKIGGCTPDAAGLFTRVIANYHKDGIEALKGVSLDHNDPRDAGGHLSH